MSKLRLSLGCWDYDRTRALMDETIRPDGIDLVYLNMSVEETFFRMLRHREFDVAEMSLSSYLISCFYEPRPFVAIPVFPSRVFRHSAIFVNADAGIKRPEDLIGKRIGCPEYQMTAPVWIRGTLADEYGVPVDSVTYYQGGLEQTGRNEKLKLDLPANIDVRPIGPNQTLSAMLRDGEIDALQTARKPSTYQGPGGPVRRLFENFVDEEQAYFRKTGIFPIMHTVVIRREVYEEHPWVAQTLYKAFCEAHRKSYQDLEETAALKTMLPWLTAHLEETRREMGKDFWPNGLEHNRETIDTFLRYHHEQGLSRRRLRVEDVFAPEAVEAFKI